MCIMKWQAKVVLVLLSVVAILAIAQSPAGNRSQAQETQVRGYWTDPSTGLTWTGKDNGTDVSWHKAMQYCRDLRLAGYSDWRLPNMGELQGIYDSSATAPGLAGHGKKSRTFTWHVKGDLFLTGSQWSSNYRMDDRGRPNGYAYYFDFNEGKPNDDQTGYAYGKRGLCVRGSRE
jgi:Protein of unknown function (DUF1566)